MKVQTKISAYIITKLKGKISQIKHTFSIKYQRLESIITELRFELEKQKTENQKLLEKLAKLSKNSTTSSKPPSSDIVKPQTPPNKSSKKLNKGGQKGHSKHERIPFSTNELHQIHQYQIHLCPVCQHELELDLNKPTRIIQQAEIINVPIQIEEHRSHACWCEFCKNHHYAKFPPEVVAAGFFKTKLAAMVAYMKNVCHCSYSNIRKFIRDVLGLTVSRGYLCKIIFKVSQSLEFSYSELLKNLPLATQVNVDETGHKENGKRFWTWVFRTDLFVLFKIDKSRGSAVLIETLGKEFNGILGCDYFSAYRKFMKDFNITIQFCLAHLIRDMKYLTTLADQQTKRYGEGLLEKIKNMFKIIHDKENMSFDDFTDKLINAKKQIIEFAIEEVPSEKNAKGKELKKAAHNMAKRFTKNGNAYFEFITNPQIDPTNNIAEQAIRFIVIDRIVTQGTRSEKGRKANERLWSVIATCHLRGQNAFLFILKSVEAFYKKSQPPSLIFNTG